MNEQVSITQIPHYEQVRLSPIETSYKKIALMQAFAFAIAGLLIIIGIILWSSMPIFFSIVVGIITIALFLRTMISYVYKKYAFREHDVLYQSGIIFQSTNIIPYVCLQHITIKQNWYSKRLGLATLCLYSASSENNIAIPGLTLTDAERWKSYLLSRIESQGYDSKEL